MTLSIMLLRVQLESRQELERIFRGEGVEVVSVGTRIEAQSLVSERLFHAAVIDIGKQEDGAAFLAELRERAPKTKLIVAAPAITADQMRLCLRAGASDFVQVPAESGELEQALRRALAQHGELEASELHQASQEIFAARDLASLPETIVGASKAVMAADTVSLLLPGVDGMLYVAHAIGLPPEIQKSIRIKIGEGIAGQVALSRKPRIIRGDARATSSGGVETRARVKSSIVYPLVSGENLLGMLTFNRTSGARDYGPAELEKASVLAAHVMLGLENRRLAEQGVAAEKLAAVGQLSAGIAHEINTPIQFIGDSVYFLEEAFQDIQRLFEKYHALTAQAEADGKFSNTLNEIKELEEEMDLPFLLEQIPKAIGRTSDGATRVAEIVRAIKEFGHPDAREKVHTDLNKAIATTLAVAKSEYKYVAEVVTDLGEIPTVLCHPGEINQVLLNLIVNAAHAVAEVVSGTDQKGTITVRSRLEPGVVAISIEDTGGGIPEAVRSRVFEPFFTTKAVGRGTGLGLPIARSIVVEKHGGALTFDTEIGRGTRFLVRLPHS